MDIMRFYDHLPVFAQNLACTLEGLRVRKNKYGRYQKEQLIGFEERKDWSYEQLCRYRDEQLQKMIEHCYHHVPYYHEMFDKNNIDYRTIRTLDDLKMIPLLNKELVIQNKDKLKADNVREKDVLHMHTSGTTGSALQFLYSKEAFAKRWAEDERYTKTIEYDIYAWSAYFCGRSIVPKNKNKAPFYRINYAMKEVMFSAFHLDIENFPNYIYGLEKYKPLFWHGYPSSICPLAQYLIDNKIQLSFQPKIIYLSSENVTDLIISQIERAFGVRPIQGYAQTEAVATFRQYRNGEMYVIEDISAVEMLPVDDGLCKVVGTSLTNYAMPFLRYDTNDLVTYEITEKGRKITSLDGREEDNIKLRNGGVIRRLDFIFKDQVNITEAQLVQKTYDCVEIHVVKGKNFTVADEEKLKKDFHDYLAGKIQFEIVYQDKIEKTKNGKMKFIISEV